MSRLMRLVAISKVEINTDKLIDLYRNGTMVLGYGGSGKTFCLTKWLDLPENKSLNHENVEFIANTTGGVSSMRLKLPTQFVPISFEKAS